MANYSLTERGKAAEDKQTPEGNIIAWMKDNDRESVTPHLVAYNLAMDVEAVTQKMNGLVKAKLLKKEGDGEEPDFGGEYEMVSPL